MNKSFTLKKRTLFSPVVVVGNLIITISKYMLIIIAAKVTTVSKSPAKMNQAFKRLLLRLSSASSALEFLQSKIMNMKMSGCLYSFKLKGCPEVANIEEGGRPLSSTPPHATRDTPVNWLFDDDWILSTNNDGVYADRSCSFGIH